MCCWTDTSGFSSGMRRKKIHKPDIIFSWLFDLKFSNLGQVNTCLSIGNYKFPDKTEIVLEDIDRQLLMNSPYAVFIIHRYLYFANTLCREQFDLFAIKTNHLYLVNPKTTKRLMYQEGIVSWKQKQTANTRSLDSRS